jgi:ATP-dependent RNA helicase SUPV3L1/SUV3
MYKPTKPPNLCLFCFFTQRPWRALGLDGLQKAAFTSSTQLPSPRSLSRLPDEDERESHTSSRRPLVRYLKPSEFEKMRGKKRLGLVRRVNFPNRKLEHMIISQLDAMEAELRASPLVEGFGLSEDHIHAAFTNYRNYIYDKTCQDLEIRETDAVWRRLVDAYLGKGEPALRDELRFGFHGHVVRSRFSESDLYNQRKIADMRYPLEWFPSTRQLTRTIHLHVGPTNSGKTYQALKRLEEADKGCYAGPLRLLAHEVYTRMNNKGKPCWLVTGEERRLPLNPVDNVPSLISCTVEMTPLNVHMDVAIIDEIQMLGDEERGWAWTEALVGVQAKELHLCGEERVVPLVKDLAAAMGDKLEIHRYKRLSPLQMEIRSLEGKLNDLQKGDCIVSFSVMGIHALRNQIERKTGRKCAVVYGSLPPETRAQQARLFNDPDNDYDFLVASDAVGMGLNLFVPPNPTYAMALLTSFLGASSGSFLRRCESMMALISDSSVFRTSSK